MYTCRDFQTFLFHTQCDEVSKAHFLRYLLQSLNRTTALQISMIPTTVELRIEHNYCNV